jgi:hypothetical protein
VARRGSQRSFVRQPELERAHGAAAEPAVELLDDEVPRGIDLVPPAVVLHEQVQRPGGEHRGLCARGEVGADRVGPHRGRHVSVEPAPEPLAVERPLEDAPHRLGPAPREEVPCAQERLRNSTSWRAGTSSSSR